MKSIDRLYEYIEYKGTKPTVFEKEIGFSSGYLSVQKKRNADLGESILKKINDYCHDLDISWLLTGEGEMLKQEIKKYNIDNAPPLIVAEPENKIEGETVIPLYDINAAAGMRLLFESGKQNIIDTIKIPYITKSDGAIFITGDSMYPLMKSGDIAVYRQIHSLDYLHYGDIYIVSYSVEGDEYVVIKYVQRSDKKDHLKLVSYNEHYNPVDIPISSVMAIAIVQANIRYNTMT
ncbi:S24 family peptidase [Dysgonomonas termitidis]|uniref:Helix-turn-helix transcriptional regulator n=1 Tax=Dysgonomonas termitidis TaxID=1516126 RepID=A0ABV9KTN0_9BACT